MIRTIASRLQQQQQHAPIFIKAAGGSKAGNEKSQPNGSGSQSQQNSFAPHVVEALAQRAYPPTPGEIMRIRGRACEAKPDKLAPYALAIAAVCRTWLGRLSSDSPEHYLLWSTQCSFANALGSRVKARAVSAPELVNIIAAYSSFGVLLPDDVMPVLANTLMSDGCRQKLSIVELSAVAAAFVHLDLREKALLVQLTAEVSSRLEAALRCPSTEWLNLAANQPFTKTAQEPNSLAQLMIPKIAFTAKDSRRRLLLSDHVLDMLTQPLPNPTFAGHLYSAIFSKSPAQRMELLKMVPNPGLLGFRDAEVIQETLEKFMTLETNIHPGSNTSMNALKPSQRVTSPISHIRSSMPSNSTASFSCPAPTLPEASVSHIRSSMLDPQRTVTSHLPTQSNLPDAPVPHIRSSIPDSRSGVLELALTSLSLALHNLAVSNLKLFIMLTEVCQRLISSPEHLSRLFLSLPERCFADVEILNTLSSLSDSVFAPFYSVSSPSTSLASSSPSVSSPSYDVSSPSNSVSSPSFNASSPLQTVSSPPHTPATAYTAAPPAIAAIVDRVSAASTADLHTQPHVRSAFLHLYRKLVFYAFMPSLTASKRVRMAVTLLRPANHFQAHGEAVISDILRQAVKGLSSADAPSTLLFARALGEMNETPFSDRMNLANVIDVLGDRAAQILGDLEPHEILHVAIVFDLKRQPHDGFFEVLGSWMLEHTEKTDSEILSAMLLVTARMGYYSGELLTRVICVLNDQHNKGNVLTLATVANMSLAGAIVSARLYQEEGLPPTHQSFYLMLADRLTYSVKFIPASRMAQSLSGLHQLGCAENEHLLRCAHDHLLKHLRLYGPRDMRDVARVLGKHGRLSTKTMDVLAAALCLRTLNPTPNPQSPPPNPTMPLSEPNRQGQEARYPNVHEYRPDDSKIILAPASSVKLVCMLVQYGWRNEEILDRLLGELTGRLSRIPPLLLSRLAWIITVADHTPSVAFTTDIAGSVLHALRHLQITDAACLLHFMTRLGGDDNGAAGAVQGDQQVSQLVARARTALKQALSNRAADLLSMNERAIGGVISYLTAANFYEPRVFRAAADALGSRAASCRPAPLLQLLEGFAAFQHADGALVEDVLAQLLPLDGSLAAEPEDEGYDSGSLKTSASVPGLSAAEMVVLAGLLPKLVCLDSRARASALRQLAPGLSRHLPKLDCTQLEKLLAIYSSDPSRNRVTQALLAKVGEQLFDRYGADMALSKLLEAAEQLGESGLLSGSLLDKLMEVMQPRLADTTGQQLHTLHSLSAAAGHASAAALRHEFIFRSTHTTNVPSPDSGATFKERAKGLFRG